MYSTEVCEKLHRFSGNRTRLTSSTSVKSMIKLSIMLVTQYNRIALIKIENVSFVLFTQYRSSVATHSLTVNVIELRLLLCPIKILNTK